MKTANDPSAEGRLSSRAVGAIGYWHHWLERWRAASTYEELRGLLHTGFSTSLDRVAYDAPSYTPVDRYRLYLSAADGWHDAELLENDAADKNGRIFIGYDERGHRDDLRPSDLRQSVARKAFDVLAANLFKTELKWRDDRRSSDLWAECITAEPLFSELQRFWAPEAARIGDVWIRNMSRHDDKPHSERLATEFLANLARFIWEWREEEVGLWLRDDQKQEIKKRNEETRARLNAAKPWTIEVLDAIKRLDTLERYVLCFDKSCIAKLKEIALRTDMWSTDTFCEPRKAATVDEACYAGSKAGWFLKRVELSQAEHKRLKAVADAKRKLEEARQDLEELSS